MGKQEIAAYFDEFEDLLFVLGELDVSDGFIGVHHDSVEQMLVVIYVEFPFLEFLNDLKKK